MIETGISIGALVLIVILARTGWNEGLFRAVARLLFVFLSVLVAMRFWHAFTGWLAESLSMSAEQTSLAGFWCLFAAVFVPLNALLGSLNEDFIPVYPLGLDRLGGLACAVVTAWMLAAAMMFSFQPIIPRYVPSYDASRLLLPLEHLPVAVFTGLEKQVTGFPDQDPRRSLLPVLETEEDKTLRVVWQ